GVWAGFFDSYQEGVQAMIREERTFWPDAKNVAIYEDIYTGIYKKIYKNNEKLFKELERYSGRSLE
ncbi:MAG: hypothetical protein GX809_06450, partial [Clostridiaceae bacterium]|nr:hypothetical protein [Clostridiaceae bacterium]